MEEEGKGALQGVWKGEHWRVREGNSGLCVWKGLVINGADGSESLVVALNEDPTLRTLGNLGCLTSQGRIFAFERWLPNVPGSDLRF